MESVRKETRLRWLSVAIYSAIVALVSLGPDLGVPSIRIPHIDKVAHFGMYFVQAILVRRAMYGTIRPRRAFIATSLECSGYGLLMEFGQLTATTGRSFDWLDAAANVVGAVAGSFVFDWQRAFLMPRGESGHITNMETS